MASTIEPPKKISVLYSADRGKPFFEGVKDKIEIACVGDSLTGWNNYGSRLKWDHGTYPEFLAELADRRVANLGVAGKHSHNGHSMGGYCKSSQ